MPRRSVNFLAAVALVVTLSTQWAQAADMPAFTMANVSIDSSPDFNTTHYSLGYTFTTTHPTIISALGAFDAGGTSVAATTGGMPVQLYYSNTDPSVGGTVDGGHTAGTPVAGFSATVLSSDPILGLNGNTYAGGGANGFRYHDLAAPLTLPAGTYELVVAPQQQNFGFLV